METWEQITATHLENMGHNSIIRSPDLESFIILEFNFEINVFQIIDMRTKRIVSNVSYSTLLNAKWFLNMEEFF